MEVKIITGFSGRGGSTEALINLTNAFNKAGINTTLFATNLFFIFDKCKCDITEHFIFNENDVLIFHYCSPAIKLKPKKIILVSHEKSVFEVAKIKQFWDVCVFSNEAHRAYHKEYKGKFEIIPNLKDKSLKPTDKTGLSKIGAVIGSFDANKNTGESIKKALQDGCDKVLLFGGQTNISPYLNIYFEKNILPLLSEKVKIMSYIENKQEMYNQITDVYSCSLSECASLVQDECASCGVNYHGDLNNTHEVSNLSNEQIIAKWIKLIKN